MSYTTTTTKHIIEHAAHSRHSRGPTWRSLFRGSSIMVPGVWYKIVIFPGLPSRMHQQQQQGGENIGSKHKNCCGLKDQNLYTWAELESAGVCKPRDDLPYAS